MANTVYWPVCMHLVGGIAFDSVIGVPSFRVGGTTLVFQWLVFHFTQEVAYPCFTEW